jgi:hypothetical protein
MARARNVGNKLPMLSERWEHSSQLSGDIGDRRLQSVPRTIGLNSSKAPARRWCTVGRTGASLNMTEMSGFELLSVVRRRFPEIVAIAMSGAYLGTDVVPTIAADAFYAKGATLLSKY